MAKAVNIPRVILLFEVMVVHPFGFAYSATGCDSLGTKSSSQTGQSATQVVSTDSQTNVGCNPVRACSEPTVDPGRSFGPMVRVGRLPRNPCHHSSLSMCISAHPLTDHLNEFLEIHEGLHDWYSTP